MSKRALLILVGGRQIPNLLVAQHLRPEIIVPVASHEALGEGDAWSQIAPALRQLCPNGVAEPISVDGFDVQQTREACNSALANHANAEWIFNLTCATKVMSIGAYEVAQQYGASAWYLDTATRRVVTLTGHAPQEDLYHLTVGDYMAAYGRTVAEVGIPPTPAQLAFAKYLGQNPRAAMTFARALQNANAAQAGRDHTAIIQLTSRSRILPKVCGEARKAGLLLSYQVAPNGTVRCALRGSHLWQFMSGLWLEIYVWAAARDAACFDDYRYGLRIPGEFGQNEIDLAATHAASLLIAECKTEEKSLERPEHLYKLDSIAGMVGGKFVGRMFISSQSVPMGTDQRKSYESFCDQARARQVVVVTGDDLINLTSILKREAGADARQRPTYTRG
jgi:hypothetical protein